MCCLQTAQPGLGQRLRKGDAQGHARQDRAHQERGDGRTNLAAEAAAGATSGGRLAVP